MKKAYVKVKNNSVKSILKRPYIAATLAGALLCAVVLSVSVPHPETTEDSNRSEPITEPAPSEQKLEIVQKKTVQPTEKTEPVTPKKNETEVPMKNETEIPKTEEIPAEETVSVGKFGEDKTLQMMRPVTGEITKPFSEGKPVKSETMGDWRVHNGMDLYAEQGTEILSPADGEIIRAETDPLTGASSTVTLM